MVSIVVVASALEDNHDNIIKSSFYTQFKRNINENYQAMHDANEEIELFGLVNIALNKHKMDKIYMDLKRIHKIAIKNEKIDFKTKVDLFVEVSKYVAKISNKQMKESPISNVNDIAAVNTVDTEFKSKIEECIKALIYTMVRLTQ